MPFRRLFNFKKADWNKYALALNTALAASKLDPTSNNYTKFADTIKVVSRKAIPRGCRKAYKPGVIKESMDLYKQYNVAFDKSPFSQITTELGEELVNNISEHRQKSWQQLIEKTDMTHSSRKAWKTIEILSNDYHC